VTLKNELLAELLRRAGFPHPPLLEPVVGEPWGYRSRFQFHRDAKTGAVGFQATRSKAIVPIDDCSVAVPEIREMIRIGQIATYAHSSPRFTVFTPTMFVEQTRVDYCRTCVVALLGKTFAFSNECFFQSNLPLLERLIPAALDSQSGEQALDLYSGVGVFARFLADHFAQVTLVEQNVEAVVWAETNLAGFPHESFAQSCTDWVRAQKGKDTHFDAVVCDPPRSGLEKPVAEWLCRTAPPAIRYVSCNPATLARDAAILCHAGYCLVSVQLFDFYPQTHHIESLALFVRPA
jgi:23S rRNA (uracil1939-C5)-methyltransferase